MPKTLPHPYTPTSRTHYPRIHAPEYTKRGYVRGCVYVGVYGRGKGKVGKVCKLKTLQVRIGKENRIKRYIKLYIFTFIYHIFTLISILKLY